MTTDLIPTCDLCDRFKGDTSGDFRVLPPVLRAFGAEVEVTEEGEGWRIRLAGGQQLKGTHVAVPGDPNAIAETILNGLLLRGSWSDPRQQTLFPDDDRTRLHARWDADLEREKKSRTLFAQHALDPSIVAAEMNRSRIVS